MRVIRALKLGAILISGSLILETPSADAQKAAAPPVAPQVSRTIPVSSARSAMPHAAHSAGNHARSAQTPAHASPHRSDLNGFDGVGSLGGSEGLQNLLNLTPNSGFNYQFLNAINGDLVQKALVDPVTQLEIAQAVRLSRALGGRFSGGAYILGGGGYYAPTESDSDHGTAPEQASSDEQQTTTQQQPQIIVVQQAPQRNAQPADSQEEASAQIPDEGQFTLVLNNGRQIEAVAFSHSNDRIIYITPDGGRASIASSELDADATVRVNQERGTPLQLPL